MRHPRHVSGDAASTIWSEGPHAVVAGGVLHLRKAERLNDRWHVVSEAPTKARLKAVPATHRILGGTSPGSASTVPGAASFCSSTFPRGTQSLSPAAQLAAAEFSARFLHDERPWSSAGNVAPLALFRRAISRQRCLTVRTAESPSQSTIFPLGLVLKAGTWFVVADTVAGVTVIRVDGISETRWTGEHFERPASFALAAAWGAWLEGQRCADRPDPGRAR